MEKGWLHGRPRAIGSLLKEATLETLWPTRCILCDEPGSLLCAACRLKLPYIDQSMACPRCGGPFGQIQCTECNTTLLEAAGLERLPFQSCSSVLTLDESARRIAVAFKDRGERHLCETMADMMSQLANPSWIAEIDAVAYIPDTAAAFRRRGFDHGQLLGRAVAQRLKKPCHGLLGRPTNVDQRMLGRRERLANMSSAFGVNPEAAGRMPSNILLVDDVITTGATLYAASMKLLESGVSNVRCITYARVW